MKTKVVPISLVVVAALLVGFFFLSKNFFKAEETKVTRAKIVTPTGLENAEKSENVQTTAGESGNYETFVPLYSGETLISTLTIDINNDGYDDEVIVVRRSNSQNLWIVPSILDFETGAYQRLDAIETEFTKVRSFSYTGMDVIGDHKNALIYQGVADNGNYIMKIFLVQTRGGKNELVTIGDFSCDGTVFIQQTDRSESYELSLSKGESFSVWVYKSDSPEGETGGAGSSAKTGEGAAGASGTKTATGQNQIQQEYRWNLISQKYELAREIKVNASRLAAKELSRIQDGTVETFGAFLTGLWYKTSNSGGEIHYLYFDYDAHEIIQLVKETQEVYEWEDSKLRHNGIYLTAINTEVMNLHRRFDIALVNVDEIRVTLRDDINLMIKENTEWDGNYKKMNQQSVFDSAGSASVSGVQDLRQYKDQLMKGPAWNSSDDLVKIKFDEITYTLQNNEVTESGVYSIFKAGEFNVIQFRSDGNSSVLNQVYAMNFNVKTVTETVKRKTVEKTVTDYDSLTFTPVTLQPTDCFATEGKVYLLTRQTE